MINTTTKTSNRLYMAIFAILNILFISLYALDNNNKVLIKKGHDELLKNIFSNTRQSILVDFSPYANGIEEGTWITFGDERRQVIAIVQKGDTKSEYMFWQIWLNKEINESKLADHFYVNNRFESIKYFMLTFYLVSLSSILITWALYPIFLRYNVFSREINSTLCIGMSYFTGVAVFLFFWRAISYIIKNAELSLLASTAILLMMLIIQVKIHKCPQKNFINAIIKYLLFNFILSIYLLLYWVVPSFLAFDNNILYLPQGLLAGGRYANISYFISHFNIIPALRQNYGQSILGSIPNFFQLNFPRLSQIFWLSSSIMFLIFLLCGFVRQAGGGRKIQLFVCLATLVACPRLTLAVVQLTDNHSAPLLTSAYPDAILGLGSLFVAHLLVFGSSSIPSGTSLGVRSFMSFSLGTLWALVGVQYLIIFVFYCCVLIIFNMDTYRNYRKSIFLILSMVIIGGIASLPFGGMATPRLFFDRYIYIQGVWIAPFIDNATVSATLHSNYLWFADPYNWILDKGYKEVYEFSQSSWETIKNAYTNINDIERLLYDFSRSIFFPLIGLIMFRRCHHVYNNHMYRSLYIFCLCCMFIGSIIYTLISTGRYSWEFSRFMNAAYLSGMAIFGLTLGSQLEQSRSTVARLVIMAGMGLSLAGPATGIALQIAGAYNNVTLAQKVKLMTSLPPLTQRKLGNESNNGR